MTTTRQQFTQRLAALDDHPWLTRRQLEHLAGVTAKTMRNWLAATPIPEAHTRTGERNVQLIDRAAAEEFVRGKLFPDEGTTQARPGPRLPVEQLPMPHAPGERWRWTDIARLRGVTPGAVSSLGKAYREHSTHPFPPAGDDRKRDAASVVTWFRWYDSERPGYAANQARRPVGDGLTGRAAQVAEMLRTALEESKHLSTAVVAAALDVSEDVARRYLSQAAGVVMPEYGLVARSRIADMDSSASALSPAQRRERVKTLLRRKAAPGSVIAVGGIEYFRCDDVKRLLGTTGD